MDARKPRLLVLNQYYWPGVEATAQLLTELCESLAEEIDVKVVTGVLHGHEDEPHRLVQNGVDQPAYECPKCGRPQTTNGSCPLCVAMKAL